MEVEGSTTFSMGVNCSYVGMERPWRVLESSARIQSFKSISVAWVDELVGAVRLTNLLKILRKISKIVEIKSRDINITRHPKFNRTLNFPRSPCPATPPRTPRHPGHGWKVVPALPTGTMTTPPPKQNLPREVCTTTAHHPNWANNPPTDPTTSMDAPVNVVQRWQGPAADAAESSFARTAVPRISPLVGPQREIRTLAKSTFAGSTRLATDGPKKPDQKKSLHDQINTSALTTPRVLHGLRAVTCVSQSTAPQSSTAVQRAVADLAYLADTESFVPAFIGDQTSTTSTEAPRAGVVPRWQDLATSVQNVRFCAKKKRQRGANVLTHRGPSHLGEVGQHSAAAEAVPLTLAARLTTGNDLSFRGRGGDLFVRGKLTPAAAASGVCDFSTPDAANDQLDTPNDQGKKL